MILETVIIAVIIAYIRGGKFKNINDLEFKYWYLAIVGYMLQQVPDVLSNLSNGKYVELASDLRFSLVVASYIFISIPLLFNMRKKGVYFALIGTILNAIVIISNNGMMPVTKTAIEATGYDKVVELGQQLDMIHFVADKNTMIKFLSDFIPIPRPYPMPQVLSIGDVFLCIGLFLFIQYMLIKEPRDLLKVS